MQACLFEPLAPLIFDTPLTDNVLELVFSFMLDSKPSDPNHDWFYIVRPAYRLLATRRVRGFEHVKMELLRRGLKWALHTKQQWIHRAFVAEADLRHEMELNTAYRNLHYEADRDRMNQICGDEWVLTDFVEPLSEDAFRGD